MSNYITLPVYIICERRSIIPDPHIILRTDKPHIIGRVVYYNTPDEMMLATTQSGVLFYQVPGYTICIQFAGVMDGNIIEANQNIIQKAMTILQEMAQVFLDDKIFYKKPYFNKRYGLNKPA